MDLRKNLWPVKAVCPVTCRRLDACLFGGTRPYTVDLGILLYSVPTDAKSLCDLAIGHSEGSKPKYLLVFFHC